MEKQMLDSLPPWEKLMKQIVWLQLADVKNKNVLDFGSGFGITASHFAKENNVVAVEPSEETVESRCKENQYEQIVGSTEELRKLKSESFDLIICHNVLEYALDRENILNEFSRLLKKDGILSLVKHNRPGRVMQMVVLLNDFESANNLLDGKDGTTSKFGAIHYYYDSDIEKWCPEFYITKTLGLRTFWDLQQNQEIQKENDWQKKIIEIEMRVSDLEEYKTIAFFHHLIIKKK